jgi:hypothetical protein
VIRVCPNSTFKDYIPTGVELDYLKPPQKGGRSHISIYRHPCVPSACNTSLPRGLLSLNGCLAIWAPGGSRQLSGTSSAISGAPPDLLHCTASVWLKPWWHYPGGTTLHCAALHCTALHCTALHCTALHCTLRMALPLMWFAGEPTFSAQNPLTEGDLSNIA